ncbi:FAD-dependent oxidoreductase [Pseudomonas sp. HY7a-MNA-CIBAN-0227]|uniref:FAD-dependent oxidoreductase n=1 Tax=Pseudomonas sp. HY7a-MNA-CIBAN-0227 TaxID=3140474 RepID=UPI00331BB2CB
MITIETPTYYTATKKYNLSSQTLEQDVEADVVVIGGGFSGINTALELAEKGITNIVVLEARYLGFGGTGRNGGQIMAGIGHDLEKIKKDVGAACARLYAAEGTNLVLIGRRRELLEQVVGKTGGLALVGEV